MLNPTELSRTEGSSASFGRIVSASFLIAGTCVGGGMLALPVETGYIGFFPSLFTMLLAWLFMTSTGLLLVEANLWMEEGAHFMTMSSRLLGAFGKFVTILLYLFMGYASLVAYNAGGANLISSSFQEVFQIQLASWESSIIFAVIFGVLVLFGTKFIGRVNTILVVGMIFAYLILISTGMKGVKSAFLYRRNWETCYFSFPLLLATFSYQMMVPSLTPYLKRDAKALKLSIYLGTTIPFVVYAIWQSIVLGTVPYEGYLGLHEAYEKGLSATESLSSIVKSSWISLSAQFFAFFALVTSYLGIALGLRDFLGDIFKKYTKGSYLALMGLLVIIPSWLFAFLYPNAFVIALEVSGGFGDTFLSGIIPVAMVWAGRYYQHYEGPYKFFGGKKTLLSIASFAIFIVVIQIIKLI